MISVMVYHSFLILRLSLPVIRLLDSFIGIGLFNALFIVGGYGFEKRPVKKHFILQCRLMLRPFFFTAVISAIVYGIFYYYFTHSIYSSLIEILRRIVSILLGIPNGQPLPIFGFELFIAGPLWYILAAFWSVVFLNIFLNYIKEKYIPVVLLIAFIAGCALRESPYNFFSIGSALFACPLVYIGYKIKKTKLLQDDSKLGKAILVTGVIAAVLSLFMFMKPVPDLLPELSWLSIVKGIHCIVSALFMFLIFTLAGTLKGKLIDAICIIGRYALDVYIAQSYVFIFPWFIITDVLIGSSFLKVLAIIAGQIVITAIPCQITYWITKIKQKRPSGGLDSAK